jgi:hypothetical protein
MTAPTTEIRNDCAVCTTRPVSVIFSNNEGKKHVHDDQNSDATIEVPNKERQLRFALPLLPKSLLKCIPNVYQEKLTPVDLRFGVVRAEEYTVPVIKAHKKALAERQFVGRAKASICFVVKRPGCVICKEQGLMLKELVDNFPGNCVAAWAVIKEIDVDNDGLLDLYQKYFHFPFFLDKKMRLYKALGRNYVNPFKFLFNVKMNARKRIEDKGIPGTVIGKGEGLMLGGVLIFDSRGEIRYAYTENSGAQELPMDELRQALTAIIGGESNSLESKARRNTMTVN